MQIDIISSTRRDAIIAAHLREYLPSLELTEMSARRWVDGSVPPVRRLFEMQLLKGAAMQACWGFSLDFVPHVSAGRVKWHRSDKTARFDIGYYGQSCHLVSPSFLYGPICLAEDLRKLLPQVVVLAQETWKRDATFDRMYEIVREKRAQYIKCWLCDDSPVYAFLAAKTGDFETSKKEIDHYIKWHDLDEEEEAKLRKSLRDYAGV